MKFRMIVLVIIFIGLCCAPVENANDTYVAVQSTFSAKKYTIIDTTILDSSTVSLSEVPEKFCTLCETDTSANAQFLDSVSFPSDFLNMEYNYFRNSVNYLKRNYKLQIYDDSVIFIGLDYVAVSPCQFIDTINRSLNNFALYGNMKEVHLNNLIAKSKSGTLINWFDAPDVSKLISDRKKELADWNRIMDSINANSSIPVVTVPRFNNWPLRDTAVYYFVNLRFSLQQ